VAAPHEQQQEQGAASLHDTVDAAGAPCAEVGARRQDSCSDGVGEGNDCHAALEASTATLLASSPGSASTTVADLDASFAAASGDDDRC
jgi:hypothetical protein